MAQLARAAETLRAAMAGRDKTLSSFHFSLAPSPVAAASTLSDEYCGRAGCQCERSGAEKENKKKKNAAARPPGKQPWARMRAFPLYARPCSPF